MAVLTADPGTGSDTVGDEPVGAASGPTTEEPRGGSRHVVRGSVWSVLAVAVQAGFGLVYQVIAARRAPQSVYGTGSALWTIVQFLNFATGMGLPVAVARFGNRSARTVNTLFQWALIYTAVSSLVGALLFGLTAPRLVREQILDAIWRFGVPAGVLLLFLLITGISFAILVDVRLVTMRRWRWVLIRVVLVGLLRLPLLYIPAVSRSPLALLFLIAGMPALSGYIGALALRLTSRREDRAPLLPLPAETGTALRYASVNYIGTLAAQSPQYVIPLVVTAFVTSEEYAAFYMAWQITVMLFLLPHTVGQVVLAEGSRASARVGHQVRTGLGLALGLMVAATVVAPLIGLGIPKAFGAGFQPGADVLVRFVAAGIPWAVTSILLARARVEPHHVRTVVITLGFAVFTLVPAWVMTARSGIEGTATGWLLGNVAAALCAVLATALLRRPTAVVGPTAAASG